LKPFVWALRRLPIAKPKQTASLSNFGSLQLLCFPGRAVFSTVISIFIAE
jgi:hypothetical protein